MSNLTLRPTSRHTTSRRSTSRRSRDGLSLIWVRVLAVFFLLFAAPGTATAVQEVLAVVCGTDCCGDFEDESGAHDGDECPGSCMHCRCSHSSAVFASWVPMVGASMAADEVAFPGLADQLLSSGYRAPPFRPPAV